MTLKYAVENVITDSPNTMPLSSVTLRLAKVKEVSRVIEEPASTIYIDVFDNFDDAEQFIREELS